MVVNLAQVMVVLLAQMMVVLDVSLKSLVVSQALLMQLVDHTLRSDNDGTFSSENGNNGYLSKVATSKLKKLIQHVLIQLVGHALS